MLVPPIFNFVVWLYKQPYHFDGEKNMNIPLDVVLFVFTMLLGFLGFMGRQLIIQLKTMNGTMQTLADSFHIIEKKVLKNSIKIDYLQRDAEKHCK